MGSRRGRELPGKADQWELRIEQGGRSGLYGNLCTLSVSDESHDEPISIKHNLVIIHNDIHVLNVTKIYVYKTTIASKVYNPNHTYMYMYCIDRASIVLLHLLF